MPSKGSDAREAWRSMAQMFLSGETHDRFHAACAAVDLPHPGALKAMLALDPEDPPSMREIAVGMHCDASYVTSLVDDLEQLGYVERQTSPTDRRVKLVVLTPAGQRAREEALEEMLRPPKGLDVLSASETRTLAAIMAKISEGYPPLG
jgi:DNA-binding MarR family transcriptional regulator